MIDQGGARISESRRRAAEINKARFPVQPKGTDFGAELNERRAQTQPGPTVRVRTSETHDGSACDCINDELTLMVGDTLELTHTCHDGRVDKVIATVLSIDVPAVIEHGVVTKR